jgi:hypothetical protein
MGKPRKENGNLTGFEYRYLNGLKAPFYSAYPPLSIKVISMGTITLGRSPHPFD